MCPSVPEQLDGYLRIPGGELPRLEPSEAVRGDRRGASADPDRCPHERMAHFAVDDATPERRLGIRCVRNHRDGEHGQHSSRQDTTLGGVVRRSGDHGNPLSGPQGLPGHRIPGHCIHSRTLGLKDLLRDLHQGIIWCNCASPIREWWLAFCQEEIDDAHSMV